MATLTGQTIAATYDALLKVTDNGPITSSLKLITDGLGNNTALSLSSVAASITGTLSVTSTIGASNLSGTNTGDETNATIKTKLGAASASQDGYLTSTDWSTFNNKVPASRTLTINGTAYDLSADRSWTISAGISGSGTVNYLPIFSGSTAIGNSIARQISGTLRVDGNNVAGYGLDVRNVTNGDGINVFVTDDGINSFGGLRGVIGASDTGVGLVSSSNSGIGLQVVSSTGILAEFYNTTTKVVDISNAGNITANQFIKSGGTSSQFLKANGSVDSTTYTPTSRTLTINGTSYDLSADRSWTVSGGISGSGTTNYISKFTSSSSIGNSLIYNDANSVLINDTFNVASNYKLQVTGDIYTSGSIAIGSVSSVSTKLLGLGRSITGATTAYGITFEGNIESTVTTNGIVYRSYPIVTGGTLSAITHYIASKNAFIGGSTVTNQYGFFADASVSGATNNYGFYGNIASATGAWNLYMNGTAQNYINGNLGIGVTVPTVKLDVSGAGLFSSSVTASSFIKSGGTSAQLLAGDGSVVTAGTNITISGGTISSSGGLSGSGTTNYVPKFTGSSAIGNSQIFDNGTNVGIATATPASRLSVWEGEMTISNLSSAYTAPMGSLAAYNVNANTGGLIFKTSNSGTNAEKMRITYDGNVGIGTSSPGSVRLNVSIAALAANNYAQIVNFTDTQSADIEFWGIAGASTGVANGTGLITSAAYTLALGAGESGSANSGKLYIKNTGNVGIGTTAPGTLLDINSSSTNDRLTFSHTGSAKAGFGVTSTGITYIYHHPSATFPMWISAVGNVGIGNTSPAYKLDVATIAVAVNQSGSVRFGATDQYGMRLNQGTNGGGVPYAQVMGPKDNNGWLALNCGSSDEERMRITSAGNVGIGTSSPARPLTVFTSAGGILGQIRMGFSDASSWTIGRETDVNGRFTIVSGASTDEKFTILTGGNVGIGTTSPYAKLMLSVAASASDVHALEITNNTDASFAVYLRNNITTLSAGGAGNMVFANSTERMRIASDGRFQVNNGGYSANCTATLRALTGTSTDKILEGISISYTSNFYFRNDGNYFFSGSNLSDARTKKDIKYLEESTLDKVMKLKPASFRYIDNEQNIKGGFIAQDIKEIFPDLVTVTKSDDDLMGVDYYGVIAILTKAIQELKLEVEELKNK
jgi:hypothetical protein